MTATAPLRALLLTLALAGCATTGRVADHPVTEAELREHIAVLASDRFEGRKPGTPSASLTTDYISAAWARAGLRPAGGNGGWFQPVPLVDSAAATGTVTLEGTRTVALAADDVAIIGNRNQVLTRHGHVWLRFTFEDVVDTRGHLAAAVLQTWSRGRPPGFRSLRARLQQTGPPAPETAIRSA